jgi:hypothetical protein
MGTGFTSPDGRILTFLLCRRCNVTGSKLHKVKAESKFLISLPPVKTTIVRIWASKRILTMVFENRIVRDVLYP